MTNEENQPTTQGQSVFNKIQLLATPIAIIIGFGLIAAAIYFSGLPTNNTAITTDQDQQTPENSKSVINPVTEEDHIMGDPNARIVLVEYSDFDCPFCRLFHDTMLKIMDEYGDTGEVAWVYRQFPIESLHPNAPRLSEASECAAEIGGNDAFWKFTNALYESREVTYGANGQVTGVAPTDLNKLPEFVATAGIDQTAFDECLDNATTRADVAEDFNNGAAIGVTGTPHTVVLFDGKQGVINGAQPYEGVKQMIEGLLQ